MRTDRLAHRARANAGKRKPGWLLLLSHGDYPLSSLSKKLDTTVNQQGHSIDYEAVFLGSEIFCIYALTKRLKMPSQRGIG